MIRCCTIPFPESCTCKPAKSGRISGGSPSQQPDSGSVANDPNRNQDSSLLRESGRNRRMPTAFLEKPVLKRISYPCRQQYVCREGRGVCGRSIFGIDPAILSIYKPKANLMPLIAIPVPIMARIRPMIFPITRIKWFPRVLTILSLREKAR